MEYLDFGIPISFGFTAQYLDQKTETRREWKDSHAKKFCKAFDRAESAGKALRVPAVSKGYHAGGKQIGHCIITSRPVKSSLSSMGYGNLINEGGMCRTVEEFTSKYFGGRDAAEVWVILFAFVPLPEIEIKFVPTSERPLYTDMAVRLAAEITPDEIAEDSCQENYENTAEPDLAGYLNHDLAEQIGIAESRIKELELDREVLPEDLYIRQRVEWTTKLECWKYTQETVTKIQARLTSEYQEIINREHPTIDEEPGYTPDFAPNKLVESSAETGGFLVKIEQYWHTRGGWIAKCNVRISQRVARGENFLIRTEELFADFHPWTYQKRELLPQYSLGSIRTAKGLRHHFPGITIPSFAKPGFTEIEASDGSIWQAYREGHNARYSIKWRCEALPDGFSRSPRIGNKKTAASTAAHQTENNILNYG
jgi:plasmid maintenance system antidote protein VapI